MPSHCTLIVHHMSGVDAMCYSTIAKNNSHLHLIGFDILPFLIEQVLNNLFCGPQSTLLQARSSKQIRLNNQLQIIHSHGYSHWIVASSVNSRNQTVQFCVCFSLCASGEV